MSAKGSSVASSSVNPAAFRDFAAQRARALCHSLGLEIDSSRIFGLDVLRAVAISDVVLQHGNNLLPSRCANVMGLLNIDGVSIFFVLSGFLIGGILIKLLERYPPNLPLLLHFWVRRWLRTLPAYFVVLILLCGLNLAFTPGFSLPGVKRYFLFAQNLRSPHPEFFGEAWSLCVEEWFYLLVPLLLYCHILGFRMTPRYAVISTAVVIIVGVTVFRANRHAAVDVGSVHQWDVLFRKQVVTRLDSLMFGVIGAAISHYHRRFWLASKLLAFWCGIGLLAFLKLGIFLQWVPVGGSFSTVFLFSCFSLSTLLLLPLLSDWRVGKGPLAAAVTLISLLSYSLYLLNLSVVQIWILNGVRPRSVEQESLLSIVFLQCAYYLVVFVLSVLLYTCVERPMMRLRDHPSLVRWLAMT